jgi:hypothetical protein
MPGDRSVSGRVGARGGRRSSFRDALARIFAGLRGRSWVWWLSMLGVVMGAGGALYAFACTIVGCTTNQCTNAEFWLPMWNGEPGVIAVVANLAQMAWPLLAVLVLVAGFVRVQGWRPAQPAPGGYLGRRVGRGFRAHGLDRGRGMGLGE